MSRTAVYVVELRRVEGNRAQTLVATAHPDVVASVRRAWARLVLAEPEPAAEPAERQEATR